MKFDKRNTALVVIDPQNDVLGQAGVSWGLVGESIRENNTVENLDRLFRAAKQVGYEVFISPHYLYPAAQAWGFGGAVEKMMLEGKEFFLPDALSLDGFAEVNAIAAGTKDCARQAIEAGIPTYLIDSEKAQPRRIRAGDARLK
jgi:hypothetical protein